MEFGNAFDHALTATALLDGDGRFLRVNPALCRFLRRSTDDLLACDLEAVVHPGDFATCRRFLQLAAEGRARSARTELRYLAGDGATVWGETRTVVLDDGQAKPLCLFVQVVDVDGRKRMEMDLTAALRASPLTVFSVGPDGSFSWCEGRDIEALGLVNATAPGASALERPVVGDLVARALAGGEARTVAEIGPAAYEVVCSPVLSSTGAVTAVRGTAVDITDWHWSGRSLAHAASHDPLTGLPNRTLLDDRLAVALSRISRSRGSVAVLFVDLDHFKDVNDELGHEAGDHLLVAAARRLEAVVRPGDTVARYSGDEFVVVCEVGDRGPDDSALVAERVVSAFGLPFAAGGREVRVTASVGLAVTDDPSADLAALLRAADRRMYRAKHRGRGRWEG